MKKPVDNCNLMSYIIFVIKAFHHKGLETFFERGSKKGIIPDHAHKLARILDRLDASLTPKDMNLPGYKLHKLAGKPGPFG